MISKSRLFAAKAFLCWDVFSDLAVQLVPLQNAVAYYIPPQNDLHTIFLFYDPTANDFAEPLFLLFHEVGHVRQHKMASDNFHQNLLVEKGIARQAFERESWAIARVLLAEFLTKQNLPATVLSAFDKYAENAAASYSDRAHESQG